MRPPFFDRQHEQMMALGDELAAAGGSRIVAGDFNATPPSLMLQTLLERSGLELASGLATWPADLGLPQIAIDHILVSPDLRILGPARIGSAAGSDHYPVIAEIAIPLND
jgi:endonuclease/exonuclease/phosphatase (EEP) superfamily protein YafD